MRYKAGNNISVDYELIGVKRAVYPLKQVRVVRQYSVKAEISDAQRKCIEGLDLWLEGSKTSMLDKIIGAAA